MDTTVNDNGNPSQDATNLDSTPDNSVYEAKIEQLTNSLAEESAKNAALQVELSTAKATNYDLLMSVPKNGAEIEPEIEDNNDDGYSINNLFERPVI